MATKKKKEARTKKQPAWRSCVDADFDAVASFSLSLYAEDPGSRDVTRADVKRTLRKLRDEPARGRCVVVKEAGEVGGYAFLCSFWSNELGGEVCTIDELYIAEGLRSRGLATSLVKGLKAGTWPWFKRCVAVELEVTPTNHRARALYERLGFVSRKNATLRLRR